MPSYFASQSQVFRKLRYFWVSAQIAFFSFLSFIFFLNHSIRLFSCHFVLVPFLSSWVMLNTLLNSWEFNWSWPPPESTWMKLKRRTNLLTQDEVSTFLTYASSSSSDFFCCWLPCFMFSSLFLVAVQTLLNYSIRGKKNLHVFVCVTLNLHFCSLFCFLLLVYIWLLCRCWQAWRM